MPASLVPSFIASLDPYIPGLNIADVQRRFGLTTVHKLASNENFLGPSPLAVDAIRRAASTSHRYPSGGQELREKLAARFHLEVENVIVGAGSEGIMSNIFRTFVSDADEVLAPFPTFIGFPFLARSRGIPCHLVPCRDWHVDLLALAASITSRTKVIYLANPNNPTGLIFTWQEFDEFYRLVPERVLIILDEAYMEYARGDPTYPNSLYYRYDNVITLRTFSKVYGLAGLRAGYGFAHPELISNLLKIKLPFEPSLLAQEAAMAALDDEEHIALSLRENARAYSFLTDSLPKLGFELVPSHANFVLVALSSELENRRLFEGLLRRGVIVRDMHGFGLPHCLRISTGTNEALAACLHGLEELTTREREVVHHAVRST